MRAWALLTSLSVAACSGDATSADGGADAGPDLAGADLTPYPWALDTRPANPTCRAPARPVSSTGVTAQQVFPALQFPLPIALLQPPGDPSRWMIVQKRGAVRTFANDNAANASTVFVDITARVNSTPSEAGLLGMAFHPAFAQNGQVFLSYTASANNASGLRSTISRFTSRDNGRTLDPASEEVLLTLDQPYQNHNGGHIAFGPDGYLYIAFGDGGSGGDPQNHAQNVGDLLGKILRIDVDAAKPYAIPPTNPFANGGGAKEIYAWGLRNPWRMSFDRGTGELWAGDVGQNMWEEVDRIRLGGNYGWRVREGAHCYNPMNNCSTAGLIDPVVEYSHADGCSITGGYVYRGAAIPSLVGTYVYGDFCTGRTWGLFFDAMGRPAPQVLLQGGISLSSFAEGLDGELYLLHYGSGRIYKLVQTAPAPPPSFPQTLSATGCVDPMDATRPAAGLIPYEVNAPLWSDGSGKERWMALPDGQKIHVNPDGDWDLPIGTVLVKTFSVGGKRVETRLFVRHADGEWGGYSYEWDDAGRDAALLPAGKSKALGGQTWSFPSRAECLTCHTAAAGRSLGLETAQLNRLWTYPNGKLSNQIETLDHIGLFDAPLPGPPASLPALSPIDGPDPVASRARAYLHANCSICHRPNGTGGGPADFRAATMLSATGACDASPMAGDLGVAGAKLIAPGRPAQSIVSLRMRSLSASRMPPLATRLVDTGAAQVVDDWIAALAGCN